MKKSKVAAITAAMFAASVLSVGCVYGPPPSEMDEDTAMYENDPRLPTYLPGDAPQEVECLEEES